MRHPSIACALILLGCGEGFVVYGGDGASASGNASSAASVGSGTGGDGSGASGGASAASTGGSGGNGGNGGGGVCAPLFFLDDFEDSMLDLAQWAPIGTGAVEAGGVLQLESAGPRNGVASVGEYDFTGGSLVAEVSAATSSGGRVALRFEGDGTQNFVTFEITDDMIRAVRAAPSPPQVVKEAAYSPTTHRFLRLRDEGGMTMVWETSSDGVSWPIFVTDASLPTFASTAVELVAVSTTAPAVVAAEVEQVWACGAL